MPLVYRCIVGAWLVYRQFCRNALICNLLFCWCMVVSYFHLYLYMCTHSLITTFHISYLFFFHILYKLSIQQYTIAHILLICKLLHWCIVRFYRYTINTTIQHSKYFTKLLQCLFQVVWGVVSVSCISTKQK